MKKHLQQPLLLIAALAALFVLILTGTVAAVFGYRHFTGRDREPMQFIIQLNEVGDRQKIPQKGAVVREVSPGSPAAKADLIVGDIILAVNGAAINESSAFIEAIDRHQAGDSITLSVKTGDFVREITLELASAGPYLGVEITGDENKMSGTGYLFGETSDIPIPLGDLDDFLPLPSESFDSPSQPLSYQDYLAALPDFPGEGLHPRSQDSSEKGSSNNPDELQDQLLIWFVEPGTPAAEAGLHAGDIIAKIDTSPVNHREDFVDYLSSLSPEDIVTLEIIREEAVLNIGVSLGSHPDDISRPYLGIFLAPELSSLHQDFDLENQND